MAMADIPEDVTNVMAFDALYTTNQIQKYKVLLPCMEPPLQKRFAVYIKFMELKYTLEYVRNEPFLIHGCNLDPAAPDFKKICQELCRYSSPDEIRQLTQLQNMMETMEQFQEISQTMSMMQELFPDSDIFTPDASGFSADKADSSDNSSMMELLFQMLAKQQP